MSATTLDGDKVSTVGITTLDLLNPKTKKSEKTDFVMCKGNCQAIMGLRTATQFGLIEVKEDNFERVRMMSHKKVVLQEFKDVFCDDKVGSLPGMQKLKVNPDVQPMVQPHRRIPVGI